MAFFTLFSVAWTWSLYKKMLAFEVFQSAYGVENIVPRQLALERELIHHLLMRLINLLFLVQFFQIQTATNTTISWPSRLKIGAKSKKGNTKFRHAFFWKCLRDFFLLNLIFIIKWGLCSWLFYCQKTLNIACRVCGMNELCLCTPRWDFGFQRLLCINYS